MRFHGRLAAALAALCMAGAQAAAPFEDVPRNHWAYGAIQRAVDAGILQGYQGRFMGEKTVNRYQMAVVLERILKAVDARGGAAAAGMSAEGIDDLRAATLEFADELAILGVRVETLTELHGELEARVAALKGGRGHPEGGLGDAFTGFVSVALVSTDDATGTSGLGADTRYTAASPDQTFFSLPQASVALDTQVGEGTWLHIQYDYATDAPSAAALGGAGVGLNEAYVVVDELFGEIGGKFGGFALPLQSWEIDGPFRTATKTITPSAVNTFFEARRYVGIEVEQLRSLPEHFRWRLGVVDGGDLALPAGPGPLAQVSTLSDGVGLGALSGSATLDGQRGVYLDLESPADPDRRWGWRASAFDLGGDVTAGAGLATSSVEQNGFQLGHWFRRGRVLFQAQYLSVEADTGTPGSVTDTRAWYALLNLEVGGEGRSSVTLRYDDFENRLEPSAGVATEGDAITVAYNRELTDTSRLQLEYLAVDHVPTPTAGLTDVEDDLIQLRYQVWF